MHKAAIFSLRSDNNKGNSKCPAIIFAANRTAKVMRQIKFLIVSMKTMKEAKMRSS